MIMILVFVSVGDVIGFYMNIKSNIYRDFRFCDVVIPMVIGLDNCGIWYDYPIF